jgi:hypothetical protein
MSLRDASTHSPTPTLPRGAQGRGKGNKGVSGGIARRHSAQRWNAKDAVGACVDARKEGHRRTRHDVRKEKPRACARGSFSDAVR